MGINTYVRNVKILHFICWLQMDFAYNNVLKPILTRRLIWQIRLKFKILSLFSHLSYFWVKTIAKFICVWNVLLFVQPAHLPRHAANVQRNTCWCNRNACRAAPHPTSNRSHPKALAANNAHKTAYNAYLQNSVQNAIPKHFKSQINAIYPASMDFTYNKEKMIMIQ